MNKMGKAINAHAVYSQMVIENIMVISWMEHKYTLW